jgi:hypothetical protein
MLTGTALIITHTERFTAERSKLKQAATVLGSLATQLAITALGGATGNVLSQ